MTALSFGAPPVCAPNAPNRASVTRLVKKMADTTKDDDERTAAQSIGRANVHVTKWVVESRI